MVAQARNLFDGIFSTAFTFSALGNGVGLGAESARYEIDASVEEQTLAARPDSMTLDVDSTNNVGLSSVYLNQPRTPTSPAAFASSRYSMNSRQSSSGMLTKRSRYVLVCLCVCVYVCVCIYIYIYKHVYIHIYICIYIYIYIYI